MFNRIVSWPRLIGAVIGGIGLSGLLGFAPFVAPPSFERLQLGYLFVFISFLILSYPLARGRNWARSVLVAGVILIGLYFFLRPVSRLVSSHEFSGPDSALTKWLPLESVLADVGDSLLMLTLPLFVVGVLCHPDVVSTFRRR